MACFWLSGLATWTPIVFGFGLEEYSLILNFQAFLLTTLVNCMYISCQLFVLIMLINFISEIVFVWFIPLMLIFGISSRVIYILLLKNKAKMKISTKARTKQTGTKQKGAKQTGGKQTGYQSEDTALGTTTNATLEHKSWNRRLFRACFNYRFTAHTKFIIIISKNIA